MTNGPVIERALAESFRAAELQVLRLLPGARL